MSTAGSAPGSLGVEARSLGIAFLMAVISYLLNLAMPSHVLDVLKVPFAAWALYSGFINITWVSLARNSLGRGYGVIVSLITAGLLLMRGEWFGIPYTWFCAAGISSFIAMGALTELVNGGVGNLACLAINWVALGLGFNAWPSPYVALIAPATYLTGYLGDRLARALASRVAL